MSRLVAATHDELVAEIDRLRAALDVCADEGDSQLKEIDRLRAELADTKADMLRIHNEKVDRVEELLLSKEELDRLRAENTSLIEALKYFADHADNAEKANCWEIVFKIDDLKQARAILAKTAKEEK